MRFMMALFALTLFASACSSDPTEIVVGSDDAAEDADDAMQDEAVAEASAPVAIQTTTTAAPSETTTLVGPPTTDFRSGFDMRESLGVAGLGIGEWAVYRPTASPDDECAAGVLAYEIDGELVHGYLEHAFNGGIRLFPGTRGQDAFVVNCEESISAVWLQGSAILPDRGYPFLETMDLFDDFGDLDPYFEFVADWGWRGDVFAGYGSLRDTYDLWTFGIADAGIVSMESLLGERLPIDPDMGFSLVVPRSWSHGSTVDGQLTSSQTSDSRVQVWTVDGTATEPLAEGDELLSSDSARVRLWDGERGNEFTSTVDATDWTFLVDDGVRVVRHVPRGSDTVVIEMFSDGGDGAVDQDLPWLVLELLRVVETS